MSSKKIFFRINLQMLQTEEPLRYTDLKTEPYLNDLDQTAEYSRVPLPTPTPGVSVQFP